MLVKKPKEQQSARYLDAAVDVTIAVRYCAVPQADFANADTNLSDQSEEFKALFKKRAQNAAEVCKRRASVSNSLSYIRAQVSQRRASLLISLTTRSDVEGSTIEAEFKDAKQHDAQLLACLQEYVASRARSQMDCSPALQKVVQWIEENRNWHLFIAVDSGFIKNYPDYKFAGGCYTPDRCTCQGHSKHFSQGWLQFRIYHGKELYKERHEGDVVVPNSGGKLDAATRGIVSCTMRQIGCRKF